MGKIIEGAYFRDLMKQPDVLRSVANELEKTSLGNKVVEKIRNGELSRIVLTGMGSSLHACYPLHRALSSAGLMSFWIESAEFLIGFEDLYRKDTLLIAVSQSGESAELVCLATRFKDFGHVIAITNNRASTLGKSAGSVLTLEAGVESTVSCKTYLATLAVLYWLRNQLLGGESPATILELRNAESVVRNYLSQWENHVADLRPVVDGIGSVFVTGRGDSLATAGTGGLILKESTRQHAEGMSAAAFRHGPLEMAGSKVLVLIFEGESTVSPLHQRLAEDIVRGGGRAELIGSKSERLGVFRLPDVQSSLSALVEILPIQMLSLAIAARDGIEAGKFERASKITNIA